MSSNFGICPGHREWYIVGTWDFVTLLCRTSASLFLQEAVNPNESKHQTVSPEVSGGWSLFISSDLSNCLESVPTCLLQGLPRDGVRIYTWNLGLLYVALSFPGFPPHFLVGCEPKLSPYSTNNKGSIHGLVAVQWPVLTLRQKRHSEPGIHLILCPSSKCCCFSNFFLLLGTLQWLHIVVGFIFCPEFIAAKCDGADMSYLTIIRSRIFPLYLCIWREHRWF